jgi:beta-ureidopropionase / N-carbamoyl-L-amino-acid hydrolase
MDALERDLLELAAIGGADDGGVNRVAWSPELMDAYAWLGRRGAELGLSHDVDAAGNAFLRWQTGSGPALLLGSHLDSVPRAGRYDGTLGVLSGLDVMRSLAARGAAPRRPLWLTAFMDEEGTRFGTSLLGSKAFVGQDVSDLGERLDAAGTTLRAAMDACGYDFDRIAEARAVDRIDGYLELHIEQGPVLETEETDVGVVSSIVGLLGLEVTLTGQANHAGTTPMNLRRDAFAGAARAALELRDLARASEGMTANVGVVRIENEGKNVVPGACTFTIDIRSSTRAGYDRLDDEARGLVERIASEERLETTFAELYRLEPVPMDAAMIDALEAAADAEGASHRRLPSGAGHDAQILGACVPAGMLFVPSRGGISHNPAEHTSPAQCAVGARVLARAVEALVC